VLNMDTETPGVVSVAHDDRKSEYADGVREVTKEICFGLPFPLAVRKLSDPRLDERCGDWPTELVVTVLHLWFEEGSGPLIDGASGQKNDASSSISQRVTEYRSMVC
jgi:hypothetical protein